MRASQLKLHGSSLRKKSYKVIDVCTEVKRESFRKKIEMQ